MQSLALPIADLQQDVLLIVAVVTSLISVYAINVWVLTVISLRNRKRVEVPPNLSSWPRVSVHLPFYNEKWVASRIIESCVNFDYPKGLMEIIVVDDSTDGTTEICRRFEAKYPDLIKVIHRFEQTNFKAGALQVALENSSGEFIALFDADCVPPKDFLKQMIPYFFLDDSIAFVQARRSYLDGQSSWLAKATSLAIDVYGFIDQRARYVEDWLAHFSGSCGIFRREAINDSGGWKADTSAEDLDLSIRLHLKGWRYVYAAKIVCPGEIPANFEILRHQNFRWARGFSECSRKYVRAILQSKRLNGFQKLEAILHLGTYFISPLTIVGIILALLYYSIFPSSFWLMGFWRSGLALVTFALSLVIYSAPLVACSVTLSEFSQLGISKVRRLLHLGYLGALVYGLLFSNTKAVIEGLFSRTSYFYRTPKVGSASTD